MKQICLLLIEFYQRIISPRKGFKCAHHALHRGPTCSNAVKSLIEEHGLIGAWPQIKARFKACRVAYQAILDTPTSRPRSDISCDLPCDVSFADCSPGNGGSGGGSCTPCDLLNCDGPKLSRRTWRRLLLAGAVVLLICSYWFYGRGVGSITITELENPKSIVSRLVQRDHPELRLLLIVDGRKYYSEITKLADSGKPTTLRFNKGTPLTLEIDTLQVLDARVNLGRELLVVGQVIEEFDQPTRRGVGQRFKYKIERRWHIF